ncbi:AraC family transcriptional regulator [Sphingobacterium multivorum]|uniref:AraC family transcriptional regulator n=1 Tax=Sphingobacterium multivorum TaxID=28454 RepID=UPI0028B23CD2|nr:AraC family transcriptional regulator [Sphingobacterium multivorum]
MRYFDFDDSKYGFPLAMDAHRFEDNTDLIFEAGPHTINFFEIMFFEQGNGVAYTNEKRIELCPGTILFASPNQIKQCDFDKNGVKGFHLIFKPEFLESFFHDKTLVYKLPYFYNYSFAPYIVATVRDFELFKSMLSEIVFEIGAFQSDSPNMIRALLASILLRLDRLFRAFHHIASESANSNLLTRFKMLMEEQINSNLNCNQYASLLKIHRNELNHKIKAYTGHSPITLLQHRKIQEIKQRLLSDEQSIAQIAFELHFSDPNNLSRFFKKLTGLSPSAYKQKMQNDSFS